MNNFRKHCVFYIITFAHERGKCRRSTPPPPPETTMLCFFLHVKSLFSPFEGSCFSFWRPFSLCVCVCGGGGGGSLRCEFFRLVPTCNITVAPIHWLLEYSCYYVHWENLRKNTRLNLSIHFGAHFHIIFEKTNEMIRC